VVLIVGGGEGMGAIYDHAAAINEARLDIRLVVVCGRNEKLRTKLEAMPVNQPTEILGFVNNLHELMAAADILVTKSGPGSIMEGCVAGLPILLYDYLPGQEVGNVRLVEARGIGHYVPKPKEVVAALKKWLDNPESMAAAALASREYAIPDSADRIATGILELLPKSESNPTQA
jgi:1,2-diacylglycerol 3-beta-galactosyltransferase